MPGTFMGKFAWQSTNDSGPLYYLGLVTGSGVDPLASMSSTTQVHWIAYDAGGGAVIVATLLPNPLYLYLYTALGWVQANASLSGALPIAISADGNTDVTWSANVGGNVLEGTYQPGTAPEFAGIVFQAGISPVSLQQIQVTPSLATAQAAGSAAGYDFSYADLTGASFQGLDCTAADFTGCILEGVDFTGATLTNAIFTGCDLTGVTWGTNLQAAGANFTNCLGRGVVFGGQAAFAGATFTGADFSGASFAGASLDGAFAYGANFSGANLAGANLSSLNAGLSNDLLGIDLSWAYMPDANLQEAHLEGADLSHVQLYFLGSGKLDAAQLIDTSLCHADLTGMSFDNTTVQGADFTDAVLINCTFTNVAFGPSPASNPVSFDGAHLEGATFAQPTTLQSVHLAGAWIADANGVPLFTTPMQTDWATSLNAGTLPTGFPALFAGFGYVLAGAATVRPGPAASQWKLSQTPVLSTPGVEIIGYLLVSNGTQLMVYASKLNLIEVSGTSAIALPLPIGPTTLPQAMLDGLCTCPNGATLQTNTAQDLTWEQMLMCTRQPVYV